MYKNLFIPVRSFVQTFVLFSFLVFLYYPSFSQSSYMCSYSSLAEKIYLQLDSKVYTTDKMIWFKAIVTDVINHAPTALSRVLHVELIDPNERIIEKKQIKIKNGIGDSFFKLSQNYAEGLYMIRAYTEWNKNFDSDFIFKEYIQVFAPTTKEKISPIKSIALLEEDNNERWLKASFDPLVLDSLQKKDLILFISFDDKKDTLLIKKNKKDGYLLNYIVPEGSQFATLKIQTENQLDYSKTIVLNEDYLDLQFFPESGELVKGIKSVVGFKALDYNGKGKQVEGEIINEKEEFVTFFKSNQLGMGFFTLENLSDSTKYFARLLPYSAETPQKIYPLPEVVSEGNVLSVKRNKDVIQIKASSNYLNNESVLIQVTCRGIIYFDIKGSLDNGSLNSYLPVNKLPEGIIAFTMKDNMKRSVAERLYFNEKPEERINIALSTDKDSYMQRELTNLKIEITRYEGEPVNANLSVLVMNKNQMGQIQSTRQNILSYFLLSSDLKGEIENPGFYFHDNNRHDDLEALMLTQGWRKYNYTKQKGRIYISPETNLNVSGTVSSLIFKGKKKDGIKLTMMTFGHPRGFYTKEADSLGRFSFNLREEYGKNMNILIQSANKSGKNKDYTIKLDTKESPAISFNHVLSIESVDSVIHAFVDKNIERKKIEDAFPLSSGDILLDEVLVQGYKMTPERKMVAEKYGKPELVIEGEKIREKEEKWSYGLYSVLLFNFPEILVNTDSTGNLYARVRYYEPTLILIDGISVPYYNYPSIACIPPSEVKSVEVIKNASNFAQLYIETYSGEVDPPLIGDIIAIYTYSGKGLFGAYRTEGILKTTIPVFSAPCEFYAPKYDKLKSDDWIKPDLRALIHWDPKITVDSFGKASASFYNADNLGEMLIVVEAISDEGEVGYKEIVYSVEKRKFDMTSM